MDILGLGVAVVDVLARVAHFPAGDDVQQAEAITLSCGGPVATALAAAARLGATTMMLDAIGDDWRGQLISASLHRAGVDCSRLFLRPGGESGLASILVRQVDGARAIHFVPGTCAEIRPEELDLNLVRGARVLHLNGRHFEAALLAAGEARKAGVLVSLDGGAGRFRAEMRQLIPLVDVCIVARAFARDFSGEKEPFLQAQAFQQAGPRLVVITDGLRGSYVLREGDRWFHQPAFPVENVVDTTGCGDAYHGAFLFGLCRDYSIESCARLASAVAAINATGLGGQSALPDLRAAEAFLHASDGEEKRMRYE